jgi:hypothetical protein
MTKIMQTGTNPVFNHPDAGKSLFIFNKAPFEKKSLNKEFRKKELLKITMEN